jgi:hypothetical protein
VAGGPPGGPPGGAGGVAVAVVVVVVVVVVVLVLVLDVDDGVLALDVELAGGVELVVVCERVLATAEGDELELELELLEPPVAIA